MKTIFENDAQKLNQKILNDFKDFKDSNELTYCSMHQETKHTNCSVVRFSATIRYGGDLDNKSLIHKDFDNFIKDNGEDYCFMSKVVCQDNIHTAEFSIERLYIVR